MTGSCLSIRMELLSRRNFLSTIKHLMLLLLLKRMYSANLAMMQHGYWLWPYRTLSKVRTSLFFILHLSLLSEGYEFGIHSSDLSDIDAEFDIQDLSYENGSQYLETITHYLSETDFLGISVSNCNFLVCSSFLNMLCTS